MPVNTRPTPWDTFVHEEDVRNFEYNFMKITHSTSPRLQLLIRLSVNDLSKRIFSIILRTDDNEKRILKL